MDVLLLGVSDKFVLREERVSLNLVNNWGDTRGFDDSVNLSNGEVRNADMLDLHTQQKLNRTVLDTKQECTPFLSFEGLSLLSRYPREKFRDRALRILHS